MRDHLLGCQAFLPPEPDPQDRTIHLRKRYPVGIPGREYRAYEDRMVGTSKPSGDHCLRRLRPHARRA